MIADQESRPGHSDEERPGGWILRFRESTSLMAASEWKQTEFIVESRSTNRRRPPLKALLEPPASHIINPLLVNRVLSRWWQRDRTSQHLRWGVPQNVPYDSSRCAPIRAFSLLRQSASVRGSVVGKWF